MRIPKSVKVGGKTYTVNITDNLRFGVMSNSAEVLWGELAINISNQSEDKMQHDFLHELVHCIADFMGYKEHDEQKIDALASALHMIIKDNKDIFEGKDNG